MNETRLEAARSAALEFVSACGNLNMARTALAQAEDDSAHAGRELAGVDLARQSISTAEAAVRGKAEVLRLALGALE
jgi:hypothetical protein